VRRVEVSAASKEGCSGARSVAYLAEHQEAEKAVERVEVLAAHSAATSESDLMEGTEEKT
jgi:hypothetical protein